MDQVIAFLTGTGTDQAGRSLTQVLGCTYEELERRHDYIQWLFPLEQPSQAVPGSPVLSPSDVARLKGSPTAQANLRAAGSLMSRFYRDNDHWLRARDHNHLRITRIIASLRRLVGDEAADVFRREIQARVTAAGAPVNRETLGYWERA